MSLSLDAQYIGMMSSRVRNFRRTSNGWNFSCPYCGDSSTNKSKARGYLYKKPDRLFYTCFNCHTPRHDMKSLLEVVDRNLAEQYRVDAFLERQQDGERAPAVVKHPHYDNAISDRLTKVSSLPPFHPAKKYVEERAIPSDKHFLLYYTPKWKEFANSIDADTYSSHDVKDEPRLVIPLLTRSGKVAGYQGRALAEDAAAKYITILVHEDNDKIFGLDRVDLNETVFVFEGPLDALFINNSLASCGGKIDSLLNEYDKDRVVVVYDNEPRNPHTIKKVQQAIAGGFKVCIWPTTTRETDVNKMVLAGLAASDIQSIISANTYQGLRAEMALNIWKRV